MTEQERYTIEKDLINEKLCLWDYDDLICEIDDDKTLITLVNLLNKLNEENEQLKQQLSDCKKDEIQLSISFMEFKMQLIEVLQQNYNYAYNQRQKNLDKSIVARNYEVLYQTIENIAETMNVDIERFPKGER